MAKVPGLTSVLKRYIEKVVDTQAVVLTSKDGIELFEEHKNRKESNTDFASVHRAACAYASSLEQIVKLGKGNAESTICWSNLGVLAHFKIDTIVVTLVLEETANLGLLQNNIQLIRKLLLPLLGEL